MGENDLTKTVTSLTKHGFIKSTLMFGTEMFVTNNYYILSYHLHNYHMPIVQNKESIIPAWKILKNRRQYGRDSSTLYVLSHPIY